MKAAVVSSFTAPLEIGQSLRAGLAARGLGSISIL